LGPLDEQPPEHPKLIGDTGMHDRIIKVADHDVPARLGRDEDLALRLDPLRLLENEVHWVPEIMPGWL